MKKNKFRYGFLGPKNRWSGQIRPLNPTTKNGP